MKHISYLIALALLLIGCGEKKNYDLGAPPKPGEKPKVHANEAPLSEKDYQFGPINAQQKEQKGNNVKDSIPKDSLTSIFKTEDAEVIPKWSRSLCKAQLVFSEEWVENGQHYAVIACQKDSVIENGSNSVASGGQLWVERYQKNGEDQPKLMWRIWDFTYDVHSHIVFKENTFLRNDLNNDGISETSFIYFISQDGFASIKTKLMLHSLDKKYAIRGLVPLHTVPTASNYRMELDTAFQSAPRVFERFARSQWDSFVESYSKKN